MATYVVTRVRKEQSVDRSHRHIEGVCTMAGLHYTRREVVGSIVAGNQWSTSAGGYTATITTLRFCPRLGCLAAPYIKTNPTSTALDNLENLPEC
jgi:hypothetical protein